MAEDKENPLLVHAFVLMAVGLAIAVFGAIGIVKNVMAGGGSTAAAPAEPQQPGKPGGAAREVQKKVQDVQRTQQDARALTSFGKRPTIGGAVSALQAGARLKDKLAPVLKVILPLGVLCAGAGMGIMGIFVLQRKDWARYLGFGLLGATLVAFIVLQAGTGGLGDRRADIAFPLVAIVVVTLLCAKFLWDLFVEKFEKTMKPGFFHAGVLAGLPVLLASIIVPWQDLSAEKAPSGAGKGTSSAGAKKEDVAEKYSWTRLNKGSSLLMKLSSESGGSLTETQMRYTLLARDEKHAKVKAETILDGKVIASQEQILKLAYAPEEGDLVVETKSETIAVEAGSFDCDYMKIKKTKPDEMTIEAWLVPDLPLPVKSISESATSRSEMELLKVVKK
jgi:hypothetical protein